MPVTNPVSGMNMTNDERPTTNEGISVILLCLGLLVSPVQASDLEPDAHVPVDQLRRGLVGVGLTVFQGARIDTFEAEVLGVLHNVFGPGRDIILARLSGGPLEHTGVIAGMSGSPVYIDGTLIGAVAYSFGAFSKEPIAGITPIAEMKAVLERPSDATSAVGGPDTWMISEEDSNPDLTDLSLPEPGGLKPVATPLTMSGFSPRVVSDLRQEFLRMGLLPVQGGGTADSTLASGPFEPGAALGVQLVRGDWSVTGIGTLTYREGDRVIGFGHSMLFGGNTAMPMTSAFIHEVLPSQLLSFKLGAAAKPMGVILQDRAPGIAGIVGQEAEMIPTRVEVRSPAGTKSFQMEILRNRDFTPLLMRAAVTNALISSEKLLGQATIRATSRIHLAEHPPLELSNIFSGPRALGEAVLGVTSQLGRLIQNPFEFVRLEEVVFDLEVEEAIRAAHVESIRLRKARFQPGDKVHFTIVLHPYLGTPETIETELTIPAEARGGKLTLRVASAGTHRILETKRAPGEHAVRDFEHLIRLMSEEDKNDELIIDLLSSKRGVTVEGREVASLPPSVLSALRFSGHSGDVKRVRQTVLYRKHVNTEYVLSGSQTVLIYVDREKDGVVFDEQVGPSPGKN